jgi:hypothetical protein
MIILLLFACAAHASLALAGHRSIVTFARLVVATGVAIILVVAVVPAFVVVDCAHLGGHFLVARILVAVIVRVMRIFAVYVTGLEFFSTCLGGPFLSSFLLSMRPPPS